MNVTPGSERTISAEEFVQWLKSDEKTISSTTVEGDVSIAGEDLRKKRIANCTFEGSLSLSPLSAESLAFNSCTFQSEVNLSISEIKSNVQFSSCPIIKKLVFSSCTGGSISIANSVIEENLNFENIDKLSRLDIDDTQIGNELIFYWIDGTENQSIIRLTNLEVQGTFSLHGYEKFPLVMVLGGKFKQISPLITNGIVQLSSGLNTLEIGWLVLDMVHELKSIRVLNATIDKITQNEVVEDKTEYRFQNSTVKSLWSMSNSAPSDLKLINVDFAPNCKIYLDNSMISGCVFSGVTWPSSSKVYSSYENQKKRSQSLKEAYRQLKQAMLKDGNNIDALAFYRNELEEYRAFVKGNPNVKWEDKFILFISWIFSNHGQSFARPMFVWLPLFHLLWFSILVLLNYQNLDYSFANHDWANVPSFIENYFKLLLPTHSFEGIKGWMMPVDIVMRLSSGFFIYHIIRASRKFAKV